jgi:hypothetical protein
MAPDPTSLPKGASVLPRVHNSLWTMGIKKDLAALAMQQGSRVNKARPHVTKVPERRADRLRYYDLQDVRTGSYITALQCSAARLTALTHGWQGP